MADDKYLSAADIQLISGRDGVASFFAALGYDTDARLPQTTAAMGITADSLQRHISHIELVAAEEDGAEPLYVYLFELKSVTIAATQGLARALRNRRGNYLLVLTSDYEQLDFVLLERSLPIATSTQMVARQVTVRPRIITVDRRTPSQVQLRVLRRFTRNEADSDAQYDKLLSAYTVADWSEPLFNNRALFSDYYLIERLPERPEWLDRPEQAFFRLRDLMAAPRERLVGQDGSNTRNMLIEPAFQALGFNFKQGTAASENNEPDYRLYHPDVPDKPVALCLAYVWNRYLDGRDEARDNIRSEENPGARVVSLLDSSEASWAIVTNGKLWRIYSANTHSRATNYYEIDLEENLAAADPNMAFRYFWLLFRAVAFRPREVVRDGLTRTACFLDDLVEESESYAKGVEDRLKDRVFEEIFPHFAEGFIEHLKATAVLSGHQQDSFLSIARQLALREEPNDEFCRQVFQGTLTFLYRLLFLLYAESRDLLPVKEMRGYWENSLTRLKEEVAGKAGNIEDQVPGALRKAYGTNVNSTDLYDRLLELFAIVDKGRRELNVPVYNGGLFLSNPDAKNETPEAANARFLLSYKIPDLYLALGLDRLTRDIDEKRQDLAFIDYKSLGVRQLGSIYEGLLEFRVQIATEKMAVVQGKKTEEVIPYREATKFGRKILTRRRGRATEERVYRPGQVYIENDRRERRATGSYYTPDHIVKYIVGHTVGPVLNERIERLRPKLREAQQAYRKKVHLAKAMVNKGMQPDNPAKVANTYRFLVDELFDLRVLDPAMGSGHFLVETVDFICDRIVGEREGFLRAFPWNPITAFLEGTRDEILANMDQQGITVDASRLTDINLLKRYILKRCVYGVDLNHMAVELAKVSLWLDCFTLGAPLSFLNHHLKRGNSLVGTTIQQVEKELGPKQNATLAMFGGRFQGLLTATATMDEIARSPDATLEQAEHSQNLFAEFEDKQAPYKRALDIWVSLYFQNDRAQEYLTVVGQDYVEEIRSGGQNLSPHYRDVIMRAIELHKEKGFFHWDLEFPEAFVHIQHGTWKAKEEQGFDAIVGNPPYDVLATEELGYDVAPYLYYYRATPVYEAAIRGKLNLYKLFICKANSLVKVGGALSFIVPMALLGDDQAKEVRGLLLRDTGLLTIESFPQKDDPRRRVFAEAKLATTVFVTKLRPSPQPFIVRTHPGRQVEEDTPTLKITTRELQEFDPDNLAIPSCTQHDWNLAVRILSGSVVRMKSVAEQNQGEVNETTCRHFLSGSEQGPEVLRGAAICLYTIREASQGTRLFLDVGGFLRGKHLDSKAWDHKRPRVGFQRSSPQNNFRRLIAAPVPAGEFCFDTVSYVTDKNSKIDLDFLLALLNSRLLEWYFRICSTNSKINEYQFNALPILSITPDASNIDWQPAVEKKEWTKATELLCGASVNHGAISNTVAEAVAEMSRQIQAIEARRVLGSRSERSRLATESQVIQDAIDAVLFGCYGLSNDEARYIMARLQEML